MSLSASVLQAVDRVVQTYINRIASQYNIDKNELMCLWTGEENKSNTNENSDISKLGKPELILLCKNKGLKTTGTKAVLIARLSETNPEVSTKSESVKKVENVPVLKKLTSKIPTVPIRRNQFGNYEHAETSFVFNHQTQKVVGKQNDDGSIEPLSETDIDICNKYKFLYELPENLDKKITLADVQVEELDEESDSEEYEQELSEEQELSDDEVYEED